MKPQIGHHVVAWLTSTCVLDNTKLPQASYKLDLNLYHNTKNASNQFNQVLFYELLKNYPTYKGYEIVTKGELGNAKRIR